MKELFENPEQTIFGKFKNIVFGWFACLVWVNIVIALLTPILGPRTPYVPTSIPYFLLFSCILAPLWEELAFRYIPIRIATLINPTLIMPVVLLSSLIFGWGHGYGTVSLLQQGVMGLIFSWVYIKNNNSYWSSTILHAMWNLTCLLHPM